MEQAFRSGHRLTERLGKVLIVATPTATIKISYNLDVLLYRGRGVYGPE